MDTAPGVTKNVFHYNALVSRNPHHHFKARAESQGLLPKINVCEKMKDWQQALDLLRQMDREGVVKNEITYSSAISACEKGGNWRIALELLTQMKERKIRPTAIA